MQTLVKNQEHVVHMLELEVTAYNNTNDDLADRARVYNNKRRCNDEQVAALKNHANHDAQRRRSWTASGFSWATPQTRRRARQRQAPPPTPAAQARARAGR